ncbi:MAG: radical SAM protein, partial [Clostridia bacterium]|nr:radical SAM protein [Clostridia bacterium]
MAGPGAVEGRGGVDRRNRIRETGGVRVVNDADRTNRVDAAPAGKSVPYLLCSQPLDTSALDGLLSAMRPEVGRVLYRCLAGGPEVSVEEAVVLFQAVGHELAGLVLTADELRRRTVGDAVTYVVTRNINFTNVCYTGCRFCAFAKHYGDPEAYWLDLEEIARRAREAWQAGATEVCIQGGLHPEMPGTYYTDIVRAVKEAVPAMH